MFEPPQRSVDHDVEASMRLFERAHVGEAAALEPRRPRKVLVVLDGSAQDRFSIAVAGALRDRFGCELAVLDARERIGGNDLAEQTADGLKARALAKPAGDSFQQILDGVTAAASDLVIVPCPYGRELDAVGPDSTGTVIDVLLARSPVPLFVVRKPFEPADSVVSRVLLVLIGENRAAPVAAAWAAGLVALSGRLQLQLVLEEEFYENVRELMQSLNPEVDLSPESLGEALTQAHARLHAALQKTAASGDFSYQFQTHLEGEAALVPLEDAGTPALLVVALERGDHASEGHVHDRIRHASNPVLVVPG
ncbi:MAG: universal stress protein [Planctomycetes bacterium]|nr:universal stress protein [Planctomycetota bacterium]